MARVVKSREAATDLMKLFVFFGKHSISLADRFLEAAEDACLRLAEMPEIGNLCESNHPALRGLRLWPINASANTSSFIAHSPTASKSCACFTVPGTLSRFS